jgi:YVTN family beta-propeller protein
VLKVDVRRNRVVARYAVPKADWITPSANALWVSTESNVVVKLDPASGAVLARIPVGQNPLASAWVGGELWVPNIDDGTISVIDPATNKVRTTFDVGKEPLAIVDVGGDAWVSSSFDGQLLRFHP